MLNLFKKKQKKVEEPAKKEFVPDNSTKIIYDSIINTPELFSSSTESFNGNTFLSLTKGDFSIMYGNNTDKVIFTPDHVSYHSIARLTQKDHYSYLMAAISRWHEYQLSKNLSGDKDTVESKLREENNALKEENSQLKEEIERLMKV